MTQYLITTFTEVTKARYNQAFNAVIADNKEKAIKKYNLYSKNRQVSKPKARNDFERNQYFFRDKTVMPLP